MRSPLRQLVSLFLLAVFLFALEGKVMHDFAHRDDFHCWANGEKHFHGEMHSCAICDFIFAPADGISSADVCSKNNLYFKITSASPLWDCYSLPVTSLFLLRAPPVS
ncbi:MAG TPA: hypothetical protein VFU15_11035 [Bacteroidia bacterium]|nr:hypothetical protein [Bacteroidia bacterium]